MFKGSRCCGAGKHRCWSARLTDGEMGDRATLTPKPKCLGHHVHGAKRLNCAALR